MIASQHRRRLRMGQTCPPLPADRTANMNALASFCKYTRCALQIATTALGGSEMGKRAEDFMDSWLEAKVTDQHLKTPEKSAPILAKKCATDAKKAGVPLEELEEVVVDIEQAITDELTVVAPQENPA
jgi:hypothetical protein